MSVSIKNIFFTTFVFGPNSDQSELGKDRKILRIYKAWRGLGKYYLPIRSLEKLEQRILVVYKISTRVGDWK